MSYAISMHDRGRARGLMGGRGGGLGGGGGRSNVLFGSGGKCLGTPPPTLPTLFKLLLLVASELIEW